MMKANIVCCVAVVLGMVPGLARGQALPWLDEAAQQTPVLAERSSAADPQAVIAAGTHVMMALRRAYSRAQWSRFHEEEAYDFSIHHLCVGCRLKVRDLREQHGHQST